MNHKYTAYCYLYEPSDDLRCDFEIASDEIASMIGLLRSLVSEEGLRSDLSVLNDLMYHINPSLRTKTTVTQEELLWLDQRAAALEKEITQGESLGEFRKGRRLTFVLPQGCTPAAYSHVIRNKCKALVRLMSRHKQQGHPVDDIVFDFVNLFSGYFFFLALKLNQDTGVQEVEFVSRVYQ
jgi:ATP:cob(I)alamin adenosyltransferase